MGAHATRNAARTSRRRGRDRRLVTASAAIMVLLLGVSACAGDSAESVDPAASDDGATAGSEDGRDVEQPDDETSGSQSPNPEEPETTHIRQGAFFSPQFAPWFVANDMGAFERFGLEAEAFAVGSAAESNAQIVSGELDVGMANPITVIFANTQGVELSIIGELTKTKEGLAAVVVMPQSDIEEPADLVGQKVGVPGLRGTGDIGVGRILTDMGIDPSSVEWVDVPYPQMPGALQSGAVEAVVMSQPQLDESKQTLDVRTIMDLATGPLVDAPEGTWVVSTAWAQENPLTVAAYQCALQEGITTAENDYDYAVDVMRGYLPSPEEVIENLRQPGWVTEFLRPDMLQATADAMYDQGHIDEPFDVSSITIRPPESCETGSAGGQ